MKIADSTKDVSTKDVAKEAASAQQGPSTSRRGRALASAAGSLCQAQSQTFCDKSMPLEATYVAMLGSDMCSALVPYLDSVAAAQKPLWLGFCCVDDCAVDCAPGMGPTADAVCGDASDVSKAAAIANAPPCDFAAQGANVSNVGPRGGSSKSYLWGGTPFKRRIEKGGKEDECTESESIEKGVKGDLLEAPRISARWYPVSFCDYYECYELEEWAKVANALEALNGAPENSPPTASCFFRPPSCGNSSCTARYVAKDHSMLFSWHDGGNHPCGLYPNQNCMWDVDMQQCVDPLFDETNDKMTEAKVQELVDAAIAAWPDLKVLQISGTATFPSQSICKLDKKMTVKTSAALTLEGASEQEHLRSTITADGDGVVMFHVFGSLTLKNMVLQKASLAILVDGSPFSSDAAGGGSSTANLLIASSSFLDNGGGVEDRENGIHDYDGTNPEWAARKAALAKKADFFPDDDDLSKRPIYYGHIRTGAAIFAAGGRVRFAEGKSVFARNKCIKGGAGIYAARGAQIDIAGPTTHVLFEDNEAPLTADYATAHNGGAIRIYGANLHITDKANVEIVRSKSDISGSVHIHADTYDWQWPASLTVSEKARLTVADGEQCAYGAILVSSYTSVDHDRPNFEPGTPEYDQFALLKVTTGGQVVISGNKAVCSDVWQKQGVKGSGAGLFIARGKVLVDGQESLLLVDSNTAEDMAGGVVLLPFPGFPTLLIARNGGKLHIRNNVAATMAGGLGLLAGSQVVITGKGSEMVLSGNDGGQNGGGLYSLSSTVRVADHATLLVVNNTAVNGGAGIFVGGNSSVAIAERPPWELDRFAEGDLHPEHRLFGSDQYQYPAKTLERLIEWKANETQRHHHEIEPDWRGQKNFALEVKHNKLTSSVPSSEGGGAGILVMPGSSLRIDRNSLFEGNDAGPMNGGGLVMATNVINPGNIGSCVDVVVEVYTRNGQWTPTSITLSTNPPSEMFTDRQDQLSFNKKFVSTTVGEHSRGKSQFCVPCGSFSLRMEVVTASHPIGLAYESNGSEYWKRWPLFEIRLARDESVILFDREEDPVLLTTELSLGIIFNVPCEDQGASINWARFRNNTAKNGGAVASMLRENSALTLKHAIFEDNVATGSHGGAVSMSGAFAGARIEESKFYNNRAELGSGGGISVHGKAALRMKNIDAAGNWALGGDGGFLFAHQADQLVLQNATIQKCAAPQGGGGGIAVSATRFALDDVAIKRCAAGQGGGGGMMLDEGSEAHLLGCHFHDNTAPKGGHMSIGASKLVLHNDSATIAWPASTPVFPHDVQLGQAPYIAVRHGPGCEAAGYEDVGDSHECLKSALQLGFANLTADSPFVPIYEEALKDDFQTKHWKDDAEATFRRPGYRMCSVKPHVLMSSVTDFVFWVESNRDSPPGSRACPSDRPRKKTEAACLRPCTSSSPCICKRRQQKHPEKIAKPTTLTRGKAALGGGMFCSASISPPGKQRVAFLSQGDAPCGTQAVRMIASSDASARIDFACFDKGVLLGSGTQIADSVAKTAGGAIAASLCSVSLQGTAVLNNSAHGDAGGVHLGTGASLAVQGGVVFQNNSAQRSGGALMCEACEAIDLHASLSGHDGDASNRFLDNRAKGGSGGAMRINAPVRAITSNGSIFEGNVAEHDGGAIFMSMSALAGSPGGAWTSEGDHFSRNTAKFGSGGALAVEGTRVRMNQGTTCRNNTAAKGGGGCLYWDALAGDADSSPWESLKPSIGGDGLVGAGNTALFQHENLAVATPPRFFTLVDDNTKRPWVMNAEDAGQDAGAFADKSPTFIFQDAYLTHVRLDAIHSAGILRASIPENIDAAYAGSDNDGITLYGGTQAKRQLQADGKAFFNFGGDSPLRIKGQPSTGPHQVDVTASVERPVKRIFKTHLGGSPSGNGRLTLNIDQCANGVKKGSKCVPCPSKTIRKIMLKNGEDANTCICDPGTIIPNRLEIGYYNASAASPSAKCDSGERFCCAPCPVGADCTPVGYPTVNMADLEGTNLEKLDIKNVELPTHSLEIHELSPKPGYWRSNKSSDVFASCADPLAEISELRASELCCPVPNNQTASICKTAMQNKSHACQVGHYGPLCRACDRQNGYVKRGNTCQFCKALGGGPPSIVASFVSIIVLTLVIFAVFVVLYIKLKLEDKGTKKKKEKKRCGCFGKTKPAAEIDKKDEPLSAEEKINQARGKNAASRLAGDQLLIGRLEGSDGGDQDVSSSGAVASFGGGDSNRSDFQVIKDRIKVVWGWLQCFGAMTTVFDSVPWPQGFRWFSVSMGRVFSFDFSSLVGFSSCQLVVPYLDNFLVHMLVPMFLIGAIVLARLPAYLLNHKTRQKQHELMMKTTTTLLLVVYPGLCTKIFGVVKCIEVEGGGGLRLAADLSVQCYDPGGVHEKALVQFWIFLILWVVGIPLVVLGLLVTHKKHLFDAESPRHKEVIHEFGSLYLQVSLLCWVFIH
jgi:hypothetical protein